MPMPPSRAEREKRALWSHKLRARDTHDCKSETQRGDLGHAKWGAMNNMRAKKQKASTQYYFIIICNKKKEKRVRFMVEGANSVGGLVLGQIVGNNEAGSRSVAMNDRGRIKDQQVREVF